MARYTITLQELVESGYKLDLDNYPIFDESYRSHLNQTIIDRFWFQEIGAETPDRFNFFLGRKMRQIMPRYNKYYEIEQEKFDPFLTTLIQQEDEHAGDESGTENQSNSYKETSKTDKKEGSTSSLTQNDNATTETTGNSTDTGSDTTTRKGSINTSETPTGQATESNYDMPQDQIDGLENYLTSKIVKQFQGVEKTESVSDDFENKVDKNSTSNMNSNVTSDAERTASSENNFTGTDSYTSDKTEGKDKTDTRTYHKTIMKKLFGRQGYDPSKLLESYRNSIINVDELILAELATLFMGIR